MVEVTLLTYLSSALDVPCYMERPEKPEGSYVVMEKTGGSLQDHVYRSTLAIQSCAKTLYEAAKLNEDVKKAMFEAIELSDIGKVSLNSDYNFTDTAMKQYRYQAVFDVVHK